MPRVGFELTTPLFEGQTVKASDRTAPWYTSADTTLTKINLIMLTRIPTRYLLRAAYNKYMDPIIYY
jgi:hypothetical protein